MYALSAGVQFLPVYNLACTYHCEHLVGRTTNLSTKLSLSTQAVGHIVSPGVAVGVPQKLRTPRAHTFSEMLSRILSPSSTDLRWAAGSGTGVVRCLCKWIDVDERPSVVTCNFTDRAHAVPVSGLYVTPAGEAL